MEAYNKDYYHYIIIMAQDICFDRNALFIAMFQDFIDKIAGMILR